MDPESQRFCIPKLFQSFARKISVQDDGTGGKMLSEQLPDLGEFARRIGDEEYNRMKKAS